MYLIAFIFVILLAFFFTKYIAKKSNLLNRSNNIKVIDGISLSSNTKLLIIEVFDIIYVIYDNNAHVLLLEKYDKEKIVSNFGDLEAEQKDIDKIIKNFFQKKIKS